MQMTAGVINNHLKFSKATKLTKVNDTYKALVNFLHCERRSPGFDIDENLTFFTASSSIENGCSKPAAMSKFSCSTQAFLPKDEKFGVYFKIGTGGDIRIAVMIGQCMLVYKLN